MLNLTQHVGTCEQKAQGLIDFADFDTLSELLTFNELPSKQLIEERASAIAALAVASNAKKALLGGAPFLMHSLEIALKERNIQVFFSFSKRVSSEEIKDNVVTKTNVFKHIGFIEI